VKNDKAIGIIKLGCKSVVNALGRVPPKIPKYLKKIRTPILQIIPKIRINFALPLLFDELSLRSIPRA
jgi:hypothetical protein